MIKITRTDYVDIDGIPTDTPAPPYNRVVALSGIDEVMLFLDPPDEWEPTFTTLGLTLSIADARRLAIAIAASADEAERDAVLLQPLPEYPLGDAADLEGIPF